MRKLGFFLLACLIALPRIVFASHPSPGLVEHSIRTFCMDCHTGRRASARFFDRGGLFVDTPHNNFLPELVDHSNRILDRLRVRGMPPTTSEEAAVFHEADRRLLIEWFEDKVRVRKAKLAEWFTALSRLRPNSLVTIIHFGEPGVHQLRFTGVSRRPRPIEQMSYDELNGTYFTYDDYDRRPGSFLFGSEIAWLDTSLPRLQGFPRVTFQDDRGERHEGRFVEFERSSHQMVLVYSKVGQDRAEPVRIIASRIRWDTFVLQP